jgi:hypothetical protein
MVRKIIQWVPIDGTRWRSDFVNGHENHGVDVPFGVAPGRVMAPLRELPTTSEPCGFLGASSWGPDMRKEA